jgi:hypothetical protein
VDKDIKVVLTEAQTDPIVAPFCLTDGRPYNLGRLGDLLKHCQDALEGFISQKRDAFPRFYFLCDGTLLEVISDFCYKFGLYFLFN